MPLAPPMMVRNTQRGPLNFSPSGDANDYVTFAGAGDPNGGDLQIMPGETQNNVNFRRALTLGLLIVEEQEADINAALAGQKAEWDQRELNRAENAESVMDHQPDNDLLMKECLGPGVAGATTGQAVCGTPVPQRADAQGVAPPLCQMHQHLAGQFTAKKTGRIVGNRDEIVWTKGGQPVVPPSTDSSTSS